MNIKILKSFTVTGFNFEIDKEGNVHGLDKNGNELTEGTDYIVENKDEIYPLSIEQSNGLKAYSPNGRS